jgi:hypothetical protein
MGISLGFAREMTYNGVHPFAQLISKIYVKGVKLSNKARQHYEGALSRLSELRKWFITIEPERAMHICELAIGLE